MTDIQFIERDGKKEYAVVPIELFERLVAAAESMMMLRFTTRQWLPMMACDDSW